MKTKTIIILLCFITQVLQTNGLIQLKNSLATSDSPLLLKILQLVDAATSDEHLFQVTLKLLRSLCICMRETLKAKEDYFNTGNHSLEPAELSSNEAEVYDVYRNIYNNTCFNLRQELTNRTHKFNVDEESAFLNHTDCGKDEKNETYNKRNDGDKSSAVKHSIPSRLEQVLFKALIQTKDLHEYRLRRYDLFHKRTAETKSTLRHCLIVILTLYPHDQKISSRKHNIDEKDLNNTLFTKSPIDVDIIDTKHDQKGKEKDESIKAEKFSECNLQSLYHFLTESDRKNLIKVYKFISKRETIKIYLEVNIEQNHTDLINHCCNNGIILPQCNKDLINNFITKPNFLDDIYINTITNIKSLAKQYETKLNDTKHNNIFATTVQDGKNEEYIITESTTKPSTHANRINYEENDMHVPVKKSNESSKLGDVTHAIVLLNDFVSKQNTKSYLKTHQTDKTDKPWTDFALKEERQHEVTTTCNLINISTALDVKGLQEKSQHESTSSLPLYESNKNANTQKYVLENVVETTPTFKQPKTSKIKERNESQGVTLVISHEKHEVKKASTSRIDMENVANNTFTMDSYSTSNDVNTVTVDIIQNTTIANLVDSTVTPTLTDSDKLTEFTSRLLNTTLISDSKTSQIPENYFETYLVRQNKLQVTDSRSAMTASKEQSTVTTLHYSLHPDVVSFTNNTTLSTDLGTKIKIPVEYSVTDHSTTPKTIPVDLKRAKKKLKYKATDHVTTLSTPIPMFGGEQILSNVQSIPEMIIPIKSTDGIRIIAESETHIKTTKPFASEEGKASLSKAVPNEITTNIYNKLPKKIKEIEINLFFDESTLDNVVKQTETITFTSESPETKNILETTNPGFQETTTKAKYQNITTNTTLRSITTLSTLNFTKSHNQSIHDNTKGINTIDRVTNVESMSTVASHVTVEEPYEHTVQKIKTNVTINGITEIPAPIETILSQSTQDVSKAYNDSHFEISNGFIGEAKPYYYHTKAGTENNKKSFMTTGLSVTTEDNKVTVQDTVPTYLRNISDDEITMRSIDAVTSKLELEVTVGFDKKVPDNKMTSFQNIIPNKNVTSTESIKSSTYFPNPLRNTILNRQSNQSTQFFHTAISTEPYTETEREAYTTTSTSHSATIRLSEFNRTSEDIQNTENSGNFISESAYKLAVSDTTVTRFVNNVYGMENYTEMPEIQQSAKTNTLSKSFVIKTNENNFISEPSNIDKNNYLEITSILKGVNKSETGAIVEIMNLASETPLRQHQSEAKVTQAFDSTFQIITISEMEKISDEPSTNKLKGPKNDLKALPREESVVNKLLDKDESLHIYISAEETFTLKNNISLNISTNTDSFQKVVNNVSKTLSSQNVSSKVESPSSHSSTSTEITPSKLRECTREHITINANISAHDFLAKHNGTFVHIKISTTPESGTKRPTTISSDNTFINVFHSSNYFTTELIKTVDKEGTTMGITARNKNQRDEFLIMPTSTMSMGSSTESITPSEHLEFTREHITINTNVSADDFLAKHNGTFVSMTLNTSPESGKKFSTTISTDNTYNNALHSPNYFTTGLSKKIDKEVTTMGIIAHTDKSLNMPTPTLAMSSLESVNHATLKTPRAKKKHRENLSVIGDDTVTEKIMLSLIYTGTTTRNELRHDEIYNFRNNGTNLTQGKIGNKFSTENIEINDVKEATKSLYTENDSHVNIQDELMPGLRTTPIMTTSHKTFNANNWSPPQTQTCSENKEDISSVLSGPELTNNSDVEGFKESTLFTPDTVFSVSRVSTPSTLNLMDVMQNTTTNKQLTISDIDQMQMKSFLTSDMESTQYSFIETFQTTQVDAQNNATITGPIFGSTEVTVTEDLGERSTTSQVTDFVSKPFNKRDQLFEKEKESSIDTTTSELVQKQFHFNESKITPAYVITKSIINGTDVNGSTESSFYKPHRMQTTFVNKHFTSTLTKANKNYTENSIAKRPKSSKSKIKLKSPVAFELNIRVGVEANKDGIQFSVLEEKETVNSKSKLRLPIATYFNSNRPDIIETLSKSEKKIFSETKINNTASLDDNITNALLKNMNTNRRSNYVTKEDRSRIAAIMEKLKKNPPVVNTKFPQRTKIEKAFVRNTKINEEIQPHQTNTTSFNASSTSIHTNFTNIKHKSKRPDSLTEESPAINHIQSIYKEHFEKIHESMNSTKYAKISATDVLKKFYQAIITLPVAGNINNSRLNMSGINRTLHTYENQEDIEASRAAFFSAKTNLGKSEQRLNKNNTNKTSTIIKKKIDKLLKKILKGKILSKSQMRKLKQKLLKHFTSKNVTSLHKFHDTVKNKYYVNVTTDSDKLTTTTPHLSFTYNSTTIEDGNAARIQKMETLTSSSPISKTTNKKIVAFENNKTQSNEKMAKGINKQMSAEIIFITTGKYISQRARHLLSHQIELESSKLKPAETIYQYTTTETNIGFNKYLTATTPLATEKRFSGIILSEIDVNLSKPKNESNNDRNETSNAAILNSSNVLTKTEVTKGTQSTFDKLNYFIEELNGVSSQKNDSITSSYVDVNSRAKITNNGKSNYNMPTIVTDAGNTTAVTNTKSRIAATKYEIITAPFQTTVAINATDTPLLITEFENTVPNKLISDNEDSKHTVAMTTVKSNTSAKSEFQSDDNAIAVTFPLTSSTLPITKVLPQLNKPNDNITPTIYNVTTKIRDMKYFKRIENTANIIPSASAARNHSEEIILSSPPYFNILTTNYSECQSSSSMQKTIGIVFTGMLNKYTYEESVTEKILHMKKSYDRNLSENDFNSFTNKSIMDSSTTDYTSISTPNNEHLEPTPQILYGLRTLLPKVQSLSNTKNVSAEYHFPATANTLVHKTDSDKSVGSLNKEIHKEKHNEKKNGPKEITNKVNDYFELPKISTVTYPANISINIKEEIINTHPIEDYFINTAEEERNNRHNIFNNEEKKSTKIPAISKTQPPFIQIPTKILLTEKKHEGNALKHEIQIINAINYNKTTTTKSTEEQHLSTNTPNLTEKNIENFNGQKKAQYLQTSENRNKEHLVSEKIYGDGNYISTATVKLTTTSVANIKISEITLPPQLSKVFNKPITETKNLSITTQIPVDDDSVDRDAFMETTIEKQSDSKTEPTFTVVDRYTNPTDTVEKKGNRNMKDNTNFIKSKVTSVKNETYINLHSDIRNNSYSPLQKNEDNFRHENENKNDKRLDIDRLKSTSINNMIYLLYPYTRQIVTNQSIENKNVLKNVNFQTFVDNVTENNKISSKNSPIATQYIIAVTDIVNQVTKVSSDVSTSRDDTSFSEIGGYDKTLETKLKNATKTQLLYFAEKSVNVSGTKIRNIINASKNNTYDQRDYLVSIKQNRSKQLQNETSRNNTKPNFFLNVHDGEKNISIIRTPTLTHVQVTKMNPVNKTTINLKPEVQKLLLISRTDRTYQNGTMGKGFRSNSKSLLPIESRDFKRKKTIEIISSRLNRPFSSFTTATTVTKNIRYNTYRPISKEELELLKYYNEHVSNTAFDKQVSEKPRPPVLGFNYSSNARRSGVSSLQSESKPILRTANYSEANHMIQGENQDHGDKGLHLALERKNNLNEPTEIMKIPHSAEIDKISHPILEININSPQIKTNEDSPPMIEINGNPLPIEINRNSAPMELNRNPVLMDSKRNLVPTGINRNSVPMEINRYSVPIEINRDPVPMGNNQNPVPMDMNRHPVTMDIKRNPAPMDVNRNPVLLDMNRNSAPMNVNRRPVSLDMNRNSAPTDENRNTVSMDMNQNSVLMDINKNLVSMDVNRNSALMYVNRNQMILDINRTLAPMDTNRHSAPMDMTRNLVPMDMKINSSPMKMNRNLGPIDINRYSLPMDMDQNLVPMDVNRNPVPIDMNKNSAPMYVNRNPARLDMNRNSAPMDMNQNPVLMDINRNSAPIDMNRNPAPFDMNQHSAPMDMNRNPVPMYINRNSASLEINRNSVTMDINRNQVLININRDSVTTEIARNPIPQKNDRSCIPEETNRNSVPMEINRDSPRTFQINRNIPPALNLNKDSSSVINPLSIIDINKNSHKMADNNRYLLVDNKNSPSTITKPWISASMFNNNGNLPPMIDNNSPSVHNSNRNPPAVIDINRYSLVVNKNSPSIVHNKWNLLSMFGNHHKNSPSIPDGNETSSIGTDDKRNGPSMTDSNKNSRSMDANMKTNKKSAPRNDYNQINNSTIKTKIISARNMAGIKKPEAIVAARKKILPMKEIKRKPLLTFGNNKKPLSIIGKNIKTRGALEINRNKHTKIVTKNFKQIGPQKEILLDSFEKINPYAVKIKEPKSQKPGMMQKKIGTGRKALMTVNTQDFLSQHRYVTPRSVVQKNTKPYPKPQRLVRKSILRPRFDNKVLQTDFSHSGQSQRKLAFRAWNIEAAKRLEHKLKSKPVFINNEIFQTNSMSQRLSNKIQQKVRPGQNIQPMRVTTKKGKLNKKDIEDPMSYMFTADYMKMTRRLAFNDRSRDRKGSNIFKNNYSPSPSYRRSFIEKSSTEAGRTPRRGRTIFFLSPTVEYDQYN